MSELCRVKPFFRESPDSRTERIYLAGSNTARLFVTIWKIMYCRWDGGNFPKPITEL